MIPDWLTVDRLAVVIPWVTAAISIALALLVGRWAWGVVGRVVGAHATPTTTMVVQRAVWWALLGLATSTALRALGFDLSVFLGAAGIVTVALGFASQTAASNLISGLFLVFERPFSVGDAITVGDSSGEVVAIDLLSVRLRTFDNRLVRIPNELLLKSQIANLTHFRIRRVDVGLQLGYDLGAERLRELVSRAADGCDLVLDEPRPLVQFVEFGDGGVRWQVSCWVEQATSTEGRVAFADALLAVFAAENIAFPARAPLDVLLNERISS